MTSLRKRRLMRTALITASLLALPLGYLLIRSLPSRVTSVTTDVALSPLVIIQGKTMGSTYRVQYWLPATNERDRAGDRGPHADTVTSPPSPVKVRELIDEELELIDREISTWNSDSILSRFNAYRGSDWFEVTPSIVDMVQFSGELTRLSAGRYDITVAPLVNAWGFGPRGRVARIPTEAEIDKLIKSVGWQFVEVRSDPPALRKRRPELEIDLSSMGAGEAADRIAQKMRLSGIDNFFVDITGEIVAGGSRVDGQPWNVGIARPLLTASTTVATVSLTDTSIATSGNYRNSVEIDGQRVVHTIDATTGRPLLSATLSVSVIDGNCRRADALATMLMTMDPEDAMRLSNEQKWNVILVCGVASSTTPATTPATTSSSASPTSKQPNQPSFELDIIWTEEAARYKTVQNEAGK